MYICHCILKYRKIKIRYFYRVLEKKYIFGNFSFLYLTCSYKNMKPNTKKKKKFVE